VTYVNGSVDTTSLLALIDELVEAHYDTIEIVCDAPAIASELTDHIAYLQRLTRITTEVVARGNGASFGCL
jgi:hypothetical protein